MQVIVHEEVDCDVHQACCHLGGRDRRLEAAFLTNYAKLLRDIAESPLRWPVRTGGTRRALMTRFPYGVYYQVFDDTVFIGAVMHLARDEHVWQERFD